MATLTKNSHVSQPIRHPHHFIFHLQKMRQKYWFVLQYHRKAQIFDGFPLKKYRKTRILKSKNRLENFENYIDRRQKRKLFMFNLEIRNCRFAWFSGIRMLSVMFDYWFSIHFVQFWKSRNFWRFSCLKVVLFLFWFQGFEGLLEQAKVCFEQSSHIIFRLYRLAASSSDKNIERSSYKVLLNRKALLIRKNLKKRHFQLLFIVQKLVSFWMI